MHYFNSWPDVTLNVICTVICFWSKTGNHVITGGSTHKNCYPSDQVHIFHPSSGGPAPTSPSLAQCFSPGISREVIILTSYLWPPGKYWTALLPPLGTAQLRASEKKASFTSPGVWQDYWLKERKPLQVLCLPEKIGFYWWSVGEFS